MSSIRKKPNGRYQADIEDRFRGVPRTKRTFKTRKEAEEWVDAVKRHATARLLGHKRRHLFGEALARYLREESPKKLTHVDDLSNATALRWPYWDAEARRFARLEDAALEDVPTELAKWSADQRGVARRRYLDNRLYQLRHKLDGRPAWYEQPDPNQDTRPEPRREVTDPALIARLDRKPGRGAFSSGTLRVRQLLVSSVLRVAWKYWSTADDRWLEQDIAGKIQLDTAAGARDGFADYDTLLSLLIAAPIGFDAAILAGAWIGWRRSNLLGGHKRHRPVPPLNWDHVVFPVYQVDPAGGDPIEIQHGYYWVDSPHSKNKAPLAQPMSGHVDQLFRMQWDARVGQHVFHRGDGRPFSEIKRLWASTKKRAGVDAGFRWHDLRHTWASWLLQGGAPDRHVQELGGWKDGASMKRYTHLRLQHLRASTELNKRAS